MVRIRRRADMCEGCMYLTRNTFSSYYCECDGTDGVPEDFPSYASLLHGMDKEGFEKRPVPENCPRELVQRYGRYD